MSHAARALLLVALAAPQAEAADAVGNYAIWGAGARSCNQYARSAADDAARRPFRDFLMGYLTAYNTIADDTYNALGDQTLGEAIIWLDGYCDEHRMDSFERAIGQLILARHSARRRSPDGTTGSWGRAPKAAADPATP